MEKVYGIKHGNGRPSGRLFAISDQHLVCRAVAADHRSRARPMVPGDAANMVRAIFSGHDRPVSTEQERIAWPLLIAATVGLAFGLQNLGLGTFNLFVVPLSEDLDWDRGAVSLGFSIIACTMAGLAPFHGTVVDRWGVRRTVIPAVIGSAAVYAAFAFVGSEIYWFYGLCLLLGVLGAGTMPTAYSRVIVSHFSARRGFALGFAMAGAALILAGFFPLIQAIIDVYGRQPAYLAIAVFCVCVPLPLVIKWMPDKAGIRTAQELVRDNQDVQGVTLKEAMQSLPFWLMSAGFTLAGTIISAVLGHLVPLAQAHGVSGAQLFLVGPTVALGLIAGRFIVGIMLDRFSGSRVVLVVLLFPLLGMSMLASGATGLIALLALLLHAIGAGGESDTMAYLASRYFGIKAFGAIFGTMYAAFIIGYAVGPLILGYSQQFTGNYEKGVDIVVVIAAITLVPFFVLGRFSYHHSS